MEILVGCDPEVFVKKDGVFHSAYNLIKGDKKNPQKVNRGAVQVDGMALEFNIDPAASEDEFCINVQDVYEQLRKMVPEYEVVATPVAHFTPEYMKQQPKEALELGCDPDFDAYEGGANKKPNAQKPMRTASGHVHIGWTNDQDIKDKWYFDQCRMAARQLDYYLGLGSILFDDDQERRSMYGNPGCFRPKSYGVEYRTLSNAWLKDEKLMRWVFRMSSNAIKDLMEGKDAYQYAGGLAKSIIKNGNRDDAAYRLHTLKKKGYNVELPPC